MEGGSSAIRSEVTMNMKISFCFWEPLDILIIFRNIHLRTCKC